MSWIGIFLAVVILGVGVWLGLGAPGWPHPPSSPRRRLQKRSLNPVQWRRSDAERPSRRRR